MFARNDHEKTADHVAGDRYVCPRCSGRGWLASPIPNEWPRACGLCKGRGSFAPSTLAHMIGEAPSTIARLADCRARPKTAARILPKLVWLFF